MNYFSLNRNQVSINSKLSLYFKTYLILLTVGKGFRNSCLTIVEMKEKKKSKKRTFGQFFEEKSLDPYMIKKRKVNPEVDEEYVDCNES